MSIVSERTISEQEVIDRLESRDCTYCEDGTLVRRQFKSNDSVVCDCCGTPAMQIWDFDQ